MEENKKEDLTIQVDRLLQIVGELYVRNAMLIEKNIELLKKIEENEKTN